MSTEEKIGVEVAGSSGPSDGLMGSSPPEIGSGVAGAVTALRAADRLFSEYAEHHRRKVPADVGKAQRNSLAALEMRGAANALETLLQEAFERVTARPKRALPDAFAGFAAGFKAGELCGRYSERWDAGKDPDPDQPPAPATFEEALAVYRAQLARG